MTEVHQSSGSLAIRRDYAPYLMDVVVAEETKWRPIETSPYHTVWLWVAPRL